MLTRRQALTGSTAVAACIAVPAARLPALASDPVVGLVAQVKAAYRARIEAYDAYEAAALDAGYSTLADFASTQVTGIKGEQYFWGRDSVMDAAGRDEGWFMRITPEERDRAVAAIDVQQDKANRVRRELGLDPLKNHADQCEAHFYDLEARMLDTPARTVAGVLAKVQSWYCDGEIEDMRGGDEPDQDMQPDLVASIYRDLERLAGEARS